jgi:hypothetical protein
MGCQNHATQVSDFVSKVKTALLTLRNEKVPGCTFSDVP